MQKLEYEIHPAANIFPMMSEKEFVEFKEDVAQNGIREPIVLLDGRLIDGRNRLRACNELGIEPMESELTEDVDPIKYVMSANLHRRHLTESQRSICAAKVATLKNGSNQHKKEGLQDCIPSIEDAASMFRVSPRSVATAKTVLAGAAADVVKAVEQGEIKVATAANLIREVPDKREQSRIAKDGCQSIKAAAKSSKPRRQARSKQTSRAKCVGDPESDEVRQFKELWARCTDHHKSVIRALILSE